MKYKSFLSEIKEVDIIEEFRSIVKKECSEICKLYKRYRSFLFRGSNKEVKLNESILNKIIPRVDRRPKDTPLELHKILDTIFESKFGWKVRSQGIFVVGNIDYTYGYGNYAHILFPANGFKYVWNIDIPDLVPYIEEKFLTLYYTKFQTLSEPELAKDIADEFGLVIIDDFGTKAEDADNYNHMTPEGRKAIWKYFQDHRYEELERFLEKYKDSFIEEYLRAKHMEEMSIKCSHYYVFPYAEINLDGMIAHTDIHKIIMDIVK